MLILSAWNYHIPLLFILYAYRFTLYGVVRQLCFVSLAARTAFMACFAAAGESKIPKTVSTAPAHHRTNGSVVHHRPLDLIDHRISRNCNGLQHISHTGT